MSGDSTSCSFCGHTVPYSHIVRGPGVNICATCTSLCARELEKRGISLPPVVEHSGGIGEGRCSICESAKRVLLLEDRGVCGSCAVGAATALLECPPEVATSIWAGAFTPELLERREKLDAANSEWAGGLHSDLAVAYSEMGLVADAVIEAAIAVKKSGADPFAVAAAMRVLLEALRLERLGELRKVLKA